MSIHEVDLGQKWPPWGPNSTKVYRALRHITQNDADIGWVPGTELVEGVVGCRRPCPDWGTAWADRDRADDEVGTGRRTWIA